MLIEYRMRLYRDKLPMEGDVVYCENVRKDDNTWYANILDYDCVEAIIKLPEAEKRNNKSSKIGFKHPAVVTSLYEGLIYASIEGVHERDVERRKKRFSTHKVVNNLCVAICRFLTSLEIYENPKRTTCMMK